MTIALYLLYFLAIIIGSIIFVIGMNIFAEIIFWPLELIAKITKRVDFINENAEKYLSKEDLDVYKKMFSDLEKIMDSKDIFLTALPRTIFQMKKIIKKFESKIEKEK